MFVAFGNGPGEEDVHELAPLASKESIFSAIDLTSADIGTPFLRSLEYSILTVLIRLGLILFNQSIAIWFLWLRVKPSSAVRVPPA